MEVEVTLDGLIDLLNQHHDDGWRLTKFLEQHNITPDEIRWGNYGNKHYSGEVVDRILKLWEGPTDWQREGF